MIGRRCIADHLPLALQVVRAGHGVLLLAAPGLAVGVLAGRQDRTLRRVARVLGVRQLIQALASVTHLDSRPVLALGVQVDLMHAASMLAAGAIFHRYRRAALLDAVVAGSFAAVGACAIRPGSARAAPPGVR